MPVVSPIRPKINVKAKCPEHLFKAVQSGLTDFQRFYKTTEKVIFDVVDLQNGDIGVSVRKIGLLSFLKSKLKGKEQPYIMHNDPDNIFRPSFLVAFENAYHNYSKSKILKQSLP